MASEDIHTTTADYMRLAIALTALKFKPISQSCTAYTLHLRTMFPLPQATKSLKSNTSWREYALRLEQNIRDLELENETKQTRTLLISHELEKASGECEEQYISFRKENRIKVGHSGTDNTISSLVEDLNLIIKEIHTDHINASCSVAVNFGCLINALDSVICTTSLVLQSRSRLHLFYSSVCKAIDAIYAAIVDLLSGPVYPPSSHIELMTTLRTAIYHVSSIVTIVSLVFKESSTIHLDNFVDKLSHVASALVRSFFPLSLRAGPCIRPMNGPQDPSTNGVKEITDLRHSVLTFVQSIHLCMGPRTVSTTWLDSIQPHRNATESCSPLLYSDAAVSESFRANAVFEGIRELEFMLRLLSRNQSAGIRGAGGEEDEEAAAVSRLAAKNAIWYICSLLHFLTYNVTSRRTGEPLDDILSSCGRQDPPDVPSHLINTSSGEKILDALFEVVINCKSPLFQEIRIFDSDNLSGVSRDNSARCANNHHTHAQPAPALEVPQQISIDEATYTMVLGVVERYVLEFGTRRETAC